MRQIITILCFGLFFLGMFTQAQAQYHKPARKNRYRQKSYRKYKQQYLYGKGSIRARLGVGFMYNRLLSIKYLKDSYQDATYSTMPTLIGTLDHRVFKKWSTGVSISYTQEDVFAPNSYNNVAENWNLRSIMLGSRISFHPIGGKKSIFDPYITLTTAYSTNDIEDNNSSLSPSGINLSHTVNAKNVMLDIKAGTNIMLHKHAGLFVEGGLGITKINFGIVGGI